MIWEPFALAIFFGAAISLAAYLVLLWPRREPAEEESPEEEEPGGGEPAAPPGPAATGPGAD